MISNDQMYKKTSLVEIISGAIIILIVAGIAAGIIFINYII